MEGPSQTQTALQARTLFFHVLATPRAGSCISEQALNTEASVSQTRRQSRKDLEFCSSLGTLFAL